MLCALSRNHCWIANPPVSNGRVSSCVLAQASPNPIVCHPEAAESLAKPRTPNEGPMQLAGTTNAADESIGPSARKKRGPQDDNSCFRPLLPPIRAVGRGTPEIEGKARL